MKTGFYLGAAAVLALGMASCSDSEPNSPANGAEKDTSLYLKVAISDVNGLSRADNNLENFEDGEGTENDIKQLQFKFFDAQGNQIYQTTANDITFSENTPNLYPSAGKLVVTTVKVDVTRGSNMPAYVVCFANPVRWTSDEAGTGAESIGQMQGLRNEIRTSYKNASGNFAMNNSVYYGQDPISGASGVKIVGAPIQAGQIFNSQAEANNATDGSVVDIYIERYASKVRFNIAENAIAPVTLGAYELTFVPEAWGINADANDMYAIKRFSTTDGNNAPIPSLAEMNNILKGWNGWNDAALFRSYWSCSPSYYATEFPSVSDNIIDLAGNGKTGAGELVDNFKLKYYSYNQIADPDNESSNPVDKNVLYTLENTMGADAYASRNPHAAAPSVILVGQTNIQGIDPGTTFYVWEDNIYFGATVPAGAAAGAKTMLDAMLATQSILAIDANGTLLTSDNIPAGVTVAVAHPDLATRNASKTLLSEELVTLQVQSYGTDALYYKPFGSSAWMPITSDDAAIYVNRQLSGQLNYAHAYTNGKGYFSIPVQHLRISEEPANSPIVDGAIDWSKVRVGDFGLVRNHVYTINVTEIGNLSAGILNLDNPIVVPMVTNDYWIRYTLNVNNWRIVPTQNVIL